MIKTCLLFNLQSCLDIIDLLLSHFNVPLREEVIIKSAKYQWQRQNSISRIYRLIRQIIKILWNFSLFFDQGKLPIYFINKIEWRKYPTSSWNSCNFINLGDSGSSYILCLWCNRKYSILLSKCKKFGCSTNLCWNNGCWCLFLIKVS